MAKACLSANTAQPFQNGDNTMKKSAKATQTAAVETSNNSSQNTTQNDNQGTAPVVIATPHKQQTAKEAIAANVQILIEQLEQGHFRRVDRLPHRNGSLSRLFLWQHFGNFETKARRNPRGRDGCVEPAWTPREEGGEGNSHPRPRHRYPAQERLRSRSRHPRPESARVGRIQIGMGWSKRPPRRQPPRPRKPSR